MKLSRGTIIARCRAALGDLPEGESKPLFVWLLHLEHLLGRPEAERRSGSEGWPPVDLTVTNVGGQTEIQRVTCQYGDEAKACRANGWGPGTVLVGDEGCGPDAIRIEWIGREIVIATKIATFGTSWRAFDGKERSHTLSCREWRVATAEELAAIEAAIEAAG